MSAPSQAWDWRADRARLTSPAMIVSCPECGARYKLPDSAIPPEGRAMRCASCKHRWFELGAEAAMPPVAPMPGLAATAPGTGFDATPPRQLVDTSAEPSHGPPTDAVEAEETAPPGHGVLKTLFALLLSAGLFAGAAAMWLPDLPPLDLARVPWLDALVHPPAPARSAVTVRFIVDRQPLGDGRTVFALTGTLANPTAAPQSLPEIEARLVDAGGRTAYRWPVVVGLRTLPAQRAVAFEASAIGDADAATRVVVVTR